MVKIEPGLTTQQGERDELLIRIANDAEGIGGDVRDIIFCRKYTSWEIGIAKNNHEAVTFDCQRILILAKVGWR